ncbi:3-methyladenine DNA glycosylase [Leucobacter sp. CX328]|uniref:3-methyladenine DNA glycosylase n=1 Tax=unclassified Leucobacter TaxID=2621730 RepID=UPI00333F4135
MDISALSAQASATSIVLSRAEWTAREAAHEARADAFSADHRARRLAGKKHPIEDFLWTYYSYKPADLRRWHPGAGVVLEGAADVAPSKAFEGPGSTIPVPARSEWRYYRTANGSDLTVDLPAFFAKRATSVDFIADLLEKTIERPPHFACFGLHEWAMVYKLTPEQIRHAGLPLRIGHEATDAVVESNPISCSHFDAYRFFTPDARPLNRLTPTRAEQINDEQAGCLHAGMDVYKWVTKLGPIMPGELLLDAFELARDIRTVDMQASPYDVSGFDLPAIPIETPDGKREYAHRQRAFTDRGNALRVRVIQAIATARAS